MAEEVQCFEHKPVYPQHYIEQCNCRTKGSASRINREVLRRYIGVSVWKAVFYMTIRAVHLECRVIPYSLGASIVSR